MRGRNGVLAVIAAVCLGFGPGPAAFAGVVEGRAALQAGDFGRALAELGAAARDGDPAAQALYATMLKDGLGVGGRDPAAAVAWYRRAAEAGNADGQLNLGYMLFHGEGAPRDREAGLDWYRRAADAGLAAAQYNLGKALWDGEGVKRDVPEARKLFAAAAAQGLPEAQFALGQALLSPPKPDPEAAFGWFDRAARQGEAPAYAKLAGMHLLGHGTRKDPVAAQAWAMVGAAAGDPLAAQLRLKLENDLTPEQNLRARALADAFAPRRERP